MLCISCNTALGYIEGNPERNFRLLDYALRHHLGFVPTKEQTIAFYAHTAR